MTRHLQKVLLLLLLSACGLTACAPSPRPEAVRIRWTSDPQTLDPLTATTPQALEVLNLIHCSLLISDATTLQFAPWLAKQMPTISRRGASTLFSYQLRPEATWDNGQPVLARDVAFTLKVLNCPGLPTEYARTQYGFVTDVELDARDPRHFTLVCNTSSPDILVSTGDYSILPEYALDPKGELRAVPYSLLSTDTAAAVRRYPAIREFARRYKQARLDKHPEHLPGCGPYALTEWADKRYLRLQRKAKWWASALTAPPTWLQAHARRLEYQIIPDNTTAQLALRRGDLDLYPMPPALDFDRLRKSADTARLTFHTSESYEITMVGFNNQHPLLQDALTRQALSLLFDVPRLMQATQPGLAYRSIGLISPKNKEIYYDSIPLLPFSTSKAVELLRQAGWQRQADEKWTRKGETLSLRISYRAGESAHETIALQFRRTALGLGIPVLLRPTEAGLLEQQLVSGETELHVRTMHGNPFSYNFMAILHSRSIGISNFTRYHSPAADQLMEDITNEPSGPSRTKLIRKFQLQLRTDPPLVVLFFLRNRFIASKQLQGVRAIPIRPGYDVLSIAPVFPR